MTDMPKPTPQDLEKAVKEWGWTRTFFDPRPCVKCGKEFRPSIAMFKHRLKNRLSKVLYGNERWPKVCPPCFLRIILDGPKEGDNDEDR